MFCSSKKNSIQAVVSGDALVVSFLSADTPRVWRGEFGQFLTSFVDIQEAQGKFNLVMRRGNGSVEEICSFKTKEAAEQALAVVSDALLNGGSGKACSSRKKGGWLKRIFKFILFLLVLFFAVTYANARYHFVQRADTSAPTATDSGKPIQPGVPTNADDILGK